MGETSDGGVRSGEYGQRHVLHRQPGEDARRRGRRAVRRLTSSLRPGRREVLKPCVEVAASDLVGGAGRRAAEVRVVDPGLDHVVHALARALIAETDQDRRVSRRGAGPLQPSDHRLAMAPYMRSELVVAALEMVVRRRRRPQGTIHHPDRGGQFIGPLFGQACHDAGIAQSTGAVGACFDDAVAETFFATKERLLYDAPTAGGPPEPSCALRSSSTSKASTTRPGCTAGSGCAPRRVRGPTGPRPTASRARHAKNLCTTSGAHSYDDNTT